MLWEHTSLENVSLDLGEILAMDTFFFFAREYYTSMYHISHLLTFDTH